MKRTIRIEWNDENGEAKLVIKTEGGVETLVSALTEKEIDQIYDDLNDVQARIDQENMES